MTSSKERHQADREWGGGATPLFEKEAEDKDQGPVECLGMTFEMK
ncbi:MAG: hypothetical protein PVH61_44660 [Candidatus Aminicenantes bacterium]|jgi:hypothetical protein